MSGEREAIRSFLGINTLLNMVSDLTSLPYRISRMEDNMARAKEQLDALSGKVDTMIGEVRSELQVLKDQQGNLDADGQAALDSIVAKVDAFTSEVDVTPAPDTEPTGETDTGEASFR